MYINCKCQLERSSGTIYLAPKLHPAQELPREEEDKQNPKKSALDKVSTGNGETGILKIVA